MAPICLPGLSIERVTANGPECVKRPELISVSVYSGPFSGLESDQAYDR